MLNLSQIESLWLLTTPYCPANNQARQLALFLSETIGAIARNWTTL